MKENASRSCNAGNLIDSQDRGMTFSELLVRARAGDSTASNLLWEQCRNYLLAIANHDLPTPALQKFGASDVVQQSLIIAHKKLPTFQGNSQGEFFAWMKKILQFECRQTTRRFQETDKRAMNRERSTADDSATLRGSLQISDPHLTPATGAAMDEQESLVCQALLQLEPLHRQVIQLRNWEDFSFEAIGQRLGRSSEAARKLWGRAIEKLEQELRRMSSNWH